MMLFIDLYPDLLKYIFNKCDPIGCYKLKCTCKKFRKLLRNNNFYSKLPNILIDASGSYHLRTVFDDVYSLLDENFILKLMIDLYPTICLPNKWYLKQNLSESYYCLNLYPAGRSISFKIAKILFILDKHISYRNTLICIKMFQTLLAQFKPNNKTEPASINDFFWFPNLYKFDFFFNKTYPNVTKILRSNF